MESNVIIQFIIYQEKFQKKKLMMTKKKSLQDTHHTPSHKIIPQTESDELSQGNSQKKI